MTTVKDFAHQISKEFKTITPESPYKILHCKMVSDIRQLKVDPKNVVSKQKKCIDYIEK